MKKYLYAVVVVAALMISPISSVADVRLAFDTSTETVEPGGMFDVNVILQVTGNEQVNGVNYFLQELSAAGFTIVNRSTAGSLFTDPYFSNAQITSTGDTQPPAGQDNALNPINDYDLGATTDTGVFATMGDNFLATFTLMAPTNPGDYSLTTTDITGVGWSGSGGNASGENAFNSHAAMTVTVVPEPTTWSLLAVGGLGALGMTVLRRRRK